MSDVLQILKQSELFKTLPEEVVEREILPLGQILKLSRNPVFNFSVFDMVLMGTTAQLSRFASPGKAQVALAEAALERLGIQHLRDRGCGNISGGERQLVLLALRLPSRQRSSSWTNLLPIWTSATSCG